MLQFFKCRLESDFRIAQVTAGCHSVGHSQQTQGQKCKLNHVRTEAHWTQCYLITDTKSLHVLTFNGEFIGIEVYRPIFPAR